MNSVIELAVDVMADAGRAVDAFGDVGSAALEMSDDVARATRSMDGVADRVDGIGSSAAQASGGIGDLGGALGLLPGPLGSVGAAMEVAGTAIMGVTGAADLLNLAMNSSIVTKAKDVVATAAHTTATIAANAASKAWAAGQWLLNAALNANPIGLVVVAVAALVGAFVLAYKRSETFREIVQGAMAGVQAAVGWVVSKVQDLAQWLGPRLEAGFKAFSKAAGPVVDFLKGVFANQWNAAKTAVEAVGNAIETVIGWLGKIKVPQALKDAADLVGKVGGALGGAIGLGGRIVMGDELAGRSLAAGIPVATSTVTVNVTGYVGSDEYLARTVDRTLRRSGARNGRPL